MVQTESQSAGAAAERLVTGTRDTGIIVLSTSLTILHINVRAVALLKELSLDGRQQPDSQALPQPIVEVASELLAQAQAQDGSTAAAQERVVSRSWKRDSKAAISLKGFILSPSNGGQARVLLLITKQPSHAARELTRRIVKKPARQGRRARDD